MQRMKLAGIEIREEEVEETKFTDSFVVENRSLFDASVYDEYSEASDKLSSQMNRSFDSPRLESFLRGAPK